MGFFRNHATDEDIAKLNEYGWKLSARINLEELSQEEEQRINEAVEKRKQEIREEARLWEELGRPITPNCNVCVDAGEDREASALYTLHDQLASGKSICIYADKCPESCEPINCLHCRNLTQPTRFEPRED